MYLTPEEQREQHEATMQLARDLKRMKSLPKEEQERQKTLLMGFLKENEEGSSRGTSSPSNISNTSEPRRPMGIVEKVMAKHGFTREEAIEAIEDFGG